VTGQYLAVAWKDGWLRRISLSLSESADFFDRIFWVWHKKCWWLPPVFGDGYTPWDVGRFYFLGPASHKKQNTKDILSTMALIAAPYNHPFHSNLEYFDQEEQSPKKPATCTQ
jgi:hypothetical protein